jgi:hypothetical protein
MRDIPLLLPPVDDWFCPNGCNVAERTLGLPPNASRFHTCQRLHGLTAPLVRRGTACKVEAIEREDYLGSEVVDHGDDGKAYMSVMTTRDDGTDLAVIAPVARGRLGGE